MKSRLRERALNDSGRSTEARTHTDLLASYSTG